MRIARVRTGGGSAPRSCPRTPSPSASSRRRRRPRPPGRGPRSRGRAGGRGGCARRRALALARLSAVDPRLQRLRATHRGRDQERQSRTRRSRRFGSSRRSATSATRAPSPARRGYPCAAGLPTLDFELEVAAVIGRAGRNLRPDEAGAHIAGYTIFNDWSARDLQMAEMRLGLGTCKGKDFANTLGPWIVTRTNSTRTGVGDRLDLDMRATVNGHELGGDTLANMAWSFEELVVLRIAWDVGATGGHPRLRDVRRRLPVRALGTPRPRRPSPTRPRRHRVPHRQRASGR